MTEQPPLTDIIQKRRLMLFGHVARMDETADAKRILTGVHQSDWSRPVGRPYTSWMATLKSDLSLHNLTFEDAIELALDKSLWRLLVASGATHWHGACRIMMMNDTIVCLSVCNAVHHGSQGNCTWLKVVPACTGKFLLSIQTLLLLDVSFSHKMQRKNKSSGNSCSWINH